MVSDAFFLISKAFWVIVNPESILILVAVLSLWRMHQGKWHAAQRLLRLVVLSLLAIAVFPVGYPLLKPLERHFVAQPKLGQVEGIKRFVLLAGLSGTGKTSMAQG